MDCCFGVLGYFICGYAFEAGGPDDSTSFIGAGRFLLVGIDDLEYKKFFHQVFFATTCATIVSGAVAERTKMFTYFAYTAMITGWVYPVMAHWVWSDGG